ncbi:hypothetical protein JIR001_31290 [Polycladomyces abyssicola]|uniref:Uncharacterized protein n=1 Tax=Polycladomyces abyssicola TaxID=1125966 RepID=A0A8D5UJ32_9BACL|nr:hypothetical protein JIR001_31290 [Polycladomyces abyssicola]
MYVAENEFGTIVGFTGEGRERSGEPGYDGELYAIYLLKEFQCQGIGSESGKGFAAFKKWRFLL